MTTENQAGPADEAEDFEDLELEDELPPGALFAPEDDEEVDTLPEDELDDPANFDEASGESLVAGAPALMPRTKALAWFVLHHLGGHAVETRAELYRISRNEGFAEVPYGAYVRPDGVIIPGRPEAYVGAAQLGINETADSICLAGNFDEADNPDGRRGWPLEPTDAQLVAAGAWLKEKLKAHPRAKFIQHRDVAKVTGNPRVATACPGSRAVKGKAARIIFLIASGYPLAEARRRALAGK